MVGVVALGDRRLGRLLEGKSEHCVDTEHMVRARNTVALPETSVLCGLGAGWGCRPSPIRT